MITREEFLKTEILKSYGSIKAFSSKIDMPYTTLMSILKEGTGGAAFENIQKICTGLGVTLSTLQSYVYTVPAAIGLEEKPTHATKIEEPIILSLIGEYGYKTEYDPDTDVLWITYPDGWRVNTDRAEIAELAERTESAINEYFDQMRKFWERFKKLNDLE